MPAPYDYAASGGYARTRADWVDFPSTSTPITQAQMDQFDQATYDLKRLSFNAKDYGALADDSTNNATAFSNVYSAAPSTGGIIRLPAGIYRAASFPQLAKNSLTIIGDGQDATTIKPTHSSGYFFDLQAVGKLHLEGLTIDGSLVTGTGQAIRFGDGTSRSIMRDVGIKNFTGNGQQMVMRLEGSLDNTFYNVDFENNGQHLTLTDTASYPSNQNVFYSCKFQTVQWASGNAILIEDSEGNIFDRCLIQGNKGNNTIGIVNNTGESCRQNQFLSCWLEDNGNAQVGSHGFHIAGFSTTYRVESTMIRDCFMGSSGTDKPGTQIYMTNANNTYIDGNYSNLGSPNKAVEEGAGVINTRLGRGNNFAGTITMTAPTVASATTIAVPPYAEMVTVTGTTTITSVTATRPEHQLTLVFSGALTFTDGSNLKLAGNFVTTADDSISLVCDGTNWFEVARSVN